MELANHPEKIDYAWCVRCLTTCETAQARLRHQHRVLTALLVGVLVCLFAAVISALSSHWLIGGLSVGTALLFGSGAWLQRRRVSGERTRFVESGQYVEIIREILPFSDRLLDLSSGQYAALIGRLNHLPIFEEPR